MDSQVSRKDYGCQPAHHPRPVHLQSQETGSKNHCRPLTPWTQPIPTPPLCLALPNTVRQNLQTQKQFLPPRRLTTAQLTHRSIYIYIYIFIPALLALSTSPVRYCGATFHSYCIQPFRLVHPFLTSLVHCTVALFVCLYCIVLCCIFCVSTLRV